MRKAVVSFVALVVVSFAIAGCRAGAPVYNVESATMSTSPTATMEGVTRAIKRAGADLGWQMKDVAPGHVEGQLFLRSHVAVVDITFDTKAFSIRYKDSTNLKYDATSATIHKNYNGWVQNLERAILSKTSAE